MTEEEFNNLIKTAGMIAVEEMEAENMRKSENDIPHKFSEEFEKKMKDFFSKYK